MSEQNKSKYRRDANEKKSKYIRDKNEKQYSSKYIRTDEEKEAYKERKNKKNEKPLSAKSRYEMYLERERLRNIAIEGEAFDAEDTLASEVEAPAVEEASVIPEEPAVELEAEETQEREYVRAKGTSTDIFNTRKANVQDEMNYRHAEKQEDKKLEKALFVRLGWTAVLLVLAIILQLPAFRFRVPFTPKFLTVDISLFPSMFAAIAYGPVTGVIISVIKNAIFVVLTPSSIGTAASNVILDTIFLVLSSIIYSRGMFSQKRYEKNIKDLKAKGQLKDNRRSRVFIGGLVASVVAALAAILTVNFVMYPILYKVYGDYGFNAGYLLEQYESALGGVHRILPFTQSLVPKIGTIERGVFFFNVPVAFIKYVAVTIVTSILYKPLSRFFHYRTKKKKK